MRVLHRLQLPGPARALAMSAAGDRLAVVADSSRGKAAPPARQRLHLFRLTSGEPAAERALALTGVPGERGEAAGARFRYGNTRLVLRDDRTAVVARLKTQLEPAWSERVEVFAVDLATGEQRGRLLDDPYALDVTGLLPAPPRHLLLGLHNTVVCLDADSLAEVCRARPIDAVGDPDEEDAVPEESLRPDGFAYDAPRRRLYLLCGYFNAAALSCYQLSPGRRRFVRRRRREVCATRPPRGPDLPSAGGVCLNPDGRGITAVFALDDLRLDLDGRPVTDFAKARADALARRGREEVPPPRTARLGWLAVLREGKDDWIEIHSEYPRDFSGGPAREQDEHGEVHHTGYRLCSAEGWEPRPVYLDDDRVLVATPTGLLQVIDVRTGEATIAHDLGGAVACLHVCPGRRRLFAGGADGSLTVLTLADDRDLAP